MDQINTSLEEGFHNPYNSETSFISLDKLPKPNTISALSFLHVNSRSLKNKMEELSLLVTLTAPTLIGISETWLVLLYVQ